MIPAPFKVVLDANVLYPFTLRDTLLRAAAAALEWTFIFAAASVRFFSSNQPTKSLSVGCPYAARCASAASNESTSATADASAGAAT